MGLILAGILLGVLFFGISFLVMARSEASRAGEGLITIGIACVLFGIVFGIFMPVSGFEKPQEFSTIELVSLRDDAVSEGKGGLFYVSVTGTNSYTYYVEVDSPYASGSQKAYESKTVSSNSVTIIEDDSYAEAKLVTYVKDGKKSFWTFAAGAKEYEYIFYVPTGTIVRDISLG